MNLKKSILTILVVLLFNASKAQRVTAMMAYDSATQYRDAADPLWDTTAPSKANLYKALSLLNKGIDYLNQPYVFDLAQGNIYVKFRRYNILNDEAHIYTLLNEKDSAIMTLQAMHDIGDHYYKSMENDAAFNSIRSDSSFKELIASMKQSESLWEGYDFKTPYREDLPLSEKMAGLSLLWSQAKYNFVHFDHAGVDWNKLYLHYLTLVPQTKSTAEYYQLLIKFYASLKDAHTNVYFPKQLYNSFHARPPFRTELIEGRVFVTEIFSDSLEKTGIKKGLEIVSINDKPVLQYAKDSVEPYQSSSTPQDMDVRKFTYALLAGAMDAPLHIKFRNKEGKVWKQSIQRVSYTNVTGAPTIDYREIGNIGYLQLNSFGDDHVKQVYDSLFPKIANTKGLVIDLRKNGGGSDDIGFHILATLTDTPYAISISKIRQYTSTSGGADQWYSFPAAKLTPSKKMYYSKPVILLISARTFSAAEDFVADFSYMNRGKMIGQTTGGSTGMPLGFDLPGGGTARVCAKDDRFPDGKKFVGIGIKPDIFIKKTVKDLYNDNDAALMKAIELLK